MGFYPGCYLSAAPAYPHPIEYELPDGSTITVLLKGDEKVKWAETLDGYSILFNADGFYEYAIHNETGDMVRSGVRAANPQDRDFFQLSFLAGLPRGLRFSRSQVYLMQQIWLIREHQQYRSFPSTGNRKTLCILMGFTDLAFTKTQAEFNNLFNQVGYSAGGATGSFKDYYLENSYNQLNVTTDVVGPFTASNTMAYYGANDANGHDIRPRELVTEAVYLADPYVNYAEYDNDNDGYVDAIYLIYAGYGEEAGGGPNAIWAHQWFITPVMLDGKIISRYACSAELRGNTGSQITSIGVICHEFGHSLGAPDYYDTNGDTGGYFYGTGNWDIMASGSWLNDGMTPAHHNGFTKVNIYNWAQATVLNQPTSITLVNAAQNSNSFYRINTATPNEYFLLEHREKILFDTHLPGFGMMIYHVHADFDNASQTNTVNIGHPQKMYPKSQNAVTNPNSQPYSYGFINAADCAWTGVGKTAFTDQSIPNSKSWAGQNTQKPITNILYHPVNKTVSFDFMGGGTVVDYTVTFSVANQYGTPVGNAQISILPAVKGSGINLCSEHSLVSTDEDGSGQGLWLSHTDVAEVDLQPTTTQKDKGTWIFWGSGQNAGLSVGLNAPGIFEGASRWYPSDLVNHNQKQIKQIGFVPFYANCTYTLKIWTGPNATEVYQQVVANPVLEQWNNITLTTPHTIDASTDLWFGVNFNSQGGYPAGVDNGPAVVGKGDMINIGGQWGSMWLTYLLNANFNLKAFVDDAVVEPIVLVTNAAGQASFTTGNGSFNYTAEKSGHATASGSFTVNNANVAVNITLNSLVTVPVVTTSAVTSITQTSATGGGNVTSDGGATVTSRGICYGLNPNPTLSDFTVASGSGTGNFSAPMSGLTPGTVYYVRAYATNSSGTAYGNQVEFTTQTSVTLPVVTTSAVTSITQTSATGGGNVTSDGGATVTSRGICWGLNPNPTLSDFTVASGSGTGSFTAPISGLTPGTVYYVRAYATNSSGTAYGNQQNFITLQETPQTYVLTLVANPVSGGYVTGGGEYEAATQVTIAATAYAGYTFINWTDHFGNYLTGNTSHVFTMPASNATLTANFGIIGYVDEPSDVFPGVYPNPASAGFYVKWEKPLEQIALLDMAGRVLLEVEPHTMEAWLSTAGIADGVYLVRIMTRERLFLSRIIVKR